MELILKYFKELSEQQVRQFTLLEEVYKEWNNKINVISRKDIDHLYERHVLHSLGIAAAFSFPGNAKVIDIGSGGGFPGIPLAIFFPNVHFHLVDATAKKLKVVDAVVTEAGLKNVSVTHTRVEDIVIKNGSTANKYDFAVSRAVAPLRDLWSWSERLIKKEKGSPGLICLKGGDLAEEIKESGLRPQIIELSRFFSEEYFREKYILYTRH